MTADDPSKGRDPASPARLAADWSSAAGPGSPRRVSIYDLDVALVDACNELGGLLRSLRTTGLPPLALRRDAALRLIGHAETIGGFSLTLETVRGSLAFDPADLRDSGSDAAAGPAAD